MSLLGTVAIIGPGLIGGSIGLALQGRQLAEHIIGVTRSKESAERATRCGVVTEATTDLDNGVQAADFVVVCTPVGGLAGLVQQVAVHSPASAVITDAGSTKRQIVEQVGDPRFVGSHPLAGDHKCGPESARADLLEGRTVVVTPTPESDSTATNRVVDFWEQLGASVMQMSPAEHDAALARTSHVPHVVAAALAAATPEGLLGLAAGGWRDTTRVAAGSPSLWRDILLDNREEVLASLDQFGAQLAALRRAIADADAQAIENHLAEGKLRRDALGS